MTPAPRIIAIETSSRRGSVALAIGKDMVSAVEFSADQRHAAELLPLIDRSCGSAGWSSASIEQVLVSIGPGSFTGLRVAVTTARHLSLALGSRIVAVPSLAVVADNARLANAPPERLAVILDAKRKQVFAAYFERRGDEYAAVESAALAEPATWLAGLPRPLTVTGEGVDYHRAAIDAAGVELLDESLRLPRAESVHRLGWRLACGGRFTARDALLPLYIRRPEAEEIWEQREAGRGD